ncbi:MAG: hypothetical protein R6V06_08445 [Kiritimatiellia bacterium]
MQTEDTMPDNCNATLWKDDNKHWNSRLVPPLILLTCFLTLFIIPLKILSYGYLPGDDAMRHAGKVLSNLSWNQILVSAYPIPDVHIGWHQFLSFFHSMFGCNADDLVAIAIIILFLCVALPLLFLFRRPESWIAGLILCYNLIGNEYRFLLGRPYVAYVAVIMAALVLRKKLNQKDTCWKTVILLTIGMAVSVWWRTMWFLYLLPIATFLMARQWRAALRLSGMLVVSTLFMAAASGQPSLIFKSLMLAFEVMGSSDYTTQLVTELQPLPPRIGIILIPVLIIISIKFRKGNIKHFVDSPVFYLFVLSWCLGYSSQRWWIDFGAPAILVMVCEETDALLSGKSNTLTPWFSLARGGTALIACAILYLAMTGDLNSRWTSALHNEYVDTTDHSIQKGLPGQEGIIYSPNMSVFYQTFFAHPNAGWRYILGYEAAFMPPDDFRIFRNIQWNNGAWKAFDPWIDKMRSQDRLWIMKAVGAPHPGIDSLEWTRITSRIWSGRKTGQSTEKPVSASLPKKS